MSPIANDACHAPRGRGGLPIATSVCALPGGRPAALSSDAILRPRIIFTDGFGAGQVQSIGYAVPLASIANPLTSVDTIQDPFSGLSGTGIDRLAARGRYRLMSGDTHSLPLGAPLSGVVDAIDFAALSERWTYTATGGRGGGGVLTSVAGGTGRPGGHWNGIELRSDSPVHAAGFVLGMDLRGVAVPSAGLTCIAFVSSFVPNLLIHDIASPYYGILPILVVTILPDLTIRLRRLDMTQEPGHSPTYYGTGSWVTLDTSAATVPSTGPFTIEAGMFTSGVQTVGGGDPVAVHNGFAFARLYTTAAPLGVMAARALDAVTGGSGTQGIGGVAYGTDATGEFGDGAGNLTRGIAGIRFDGVVAYDNGGTVRQYLYDCRVGTSFPLSEGSPVQSTAHGSTRVGNIARALDSLAGLESTYNRYTAAQRDLFVPQAARPQAADILALVPFTCTDPAPFGGGLPGNGKVLVAVGATELSQRLSASGSVTNIIDEVLVLEQNPATARAFTPDDIASSVRVGWQNDKAASNSGDTVVFQLGLEYVYRERVVRVTERAAVAPIATFGFVANVAGNVIDFQDTSVKYDGAIVANHWNWGDDTTSDNVGSQAISGSLSAHHAHTYSAPGTYTVTLTVTGDDSTTASVSHDVTIPNQAPVASFAFTQAPASLVVDFTDASTDPDGVIASRLWNFGDGQTSTATNPSHTYATGGTYTVTLTVTDNLGGTGSASQSVTAPPAVSSCALSTFALANTPSVQGDDFGGGNPPFPAYANTAEFATWYWDQTPLRQAYAVTYPNENDGVWFSLDVVTTFHGHPTLKSTYGNSPAPAHHAAYTGAAWDAVPSDDGDPTETGYAAPLLGPEAMWVRIRFKADVGITAAAALGDADTASGLGVIDVVGPNLQVMLTNRNGKILLDYFFRGSAGSGFTNQSFIDLGSDGTFFGASGFGELILLVDGNSTAHTTRVAVWNGPACNLAGTSPAYSHTFTSHNGSGGNATRGLSIDTIRFMECAFGPSGANKHLWVADWEMMPTSVSANPFGVSLV